MLHTHAYSIVKNDTNRVASNFDMWHMYFIYHKSLKVICRSKITDNKNEFHSKSRIEK